MDSYYAKNKQKVIEYQQERYLKNKVEIQEYNSKYYIANKSILKFKNTIRKLSTDVVLLNEKIDLLTETNKNKIQSIIPNEINQEKPKKKYNAQIKNKTPPKYLIEELDIYFD